MKSRITRACHLRLTFPYESVHISMYLTIPSGMEDLDSLDRYSMMSFVWRPTLTAAYREY